MNSTKYSFYYTATIQSLFFVTSLCKHALQFPTVPSVTAWKFEFVFL